MKENELLEAEIDRYLEGTMDAAEKAAFEIKMADSDELRKAVILQRSIIKAVRREQLGKIIQNKEASIKRKGKIRKMVISYGTLAAAACMAGFFYVGYLNDCENLANRYYVSYAYNTIPSRGGENLPLTKSDSIFFDALRELENGNKKTAISLLENLKDSKPEMMAADAQVVKWYLALAYLKNGEKKRARILLKEILNMQESDYKQKAKDLLKAL